MQVKPVLHNIAKPVKLCLMFVARFSFSKPILATKKLEIHGKIVTHTHTFNGPFSCTTQVSGYQKGKTNLDFTGARDSEWQWHQLGHMQVCN